MRDDCEAGGDGGVHFDDGDADSDADGDGERGHDRARVFQDQT